VTNEHCIYLELGSNIEPELNLPLAIEILSQMVKVERISTVWETPAVGSSGPNFLNMAVEIQSDLAPDALKHLVLRNIEAYLGRRRTVNKNAPRTIDIDITIVDGKVVDDKLWQHAHVAIPLAELIPDLINESNGESLKRTSERLSASEPICQRSNLKFVLRG
jgi:2-amino-4-hydroxy-6-hydroxymethyldihydropteridine diphosphokinase